MKEDFVRGAHLICGDCGDILPTIESGSISEIVTDVPYGVSFSSRNTTYNDHKDFILSQIPKWMTEWHRVLAPNAWMFLFTGVKNINVWIDEAEQAGFTFKNILATRSFNRGRMVSNNFVFEMQPVLCFTKDGKGRNFNSVDMFPTSPEWLRDSRNKNPKPFTYSYPNFIPSEITYGTAKFGSDSISNNRHPNEKSEDLVRFLIEIATEPGDTVLDPFTGSGTTGASAVSVGRRFVGIEMDEHWYNVSRVRIGATGDWKKIPAGGSSDGTPTPIQGELF